jgi:hypothetical protein
MHIAEFFCHAYSFVVKMQEFLIPLTANKILKNARHVPCVLPSHCSSPL